MRLISNRANRRKFRRCLTSAAVLAAYVVTAIGVPLPAGGSNRPGNGESYPCAGGSCGCRSAEHCWRSCCCHTLAGRMKWAREHKVRPPEFAIAEARRAGIDLSWLDGRSGASLVAEATDPSRLVGRRSCCSQHAGPVKGKCCSRPGSDESAEKNGGHIVGWRALECKGHSMNWLAAAPSLICLSDMPVELFVIGRLGPANSEHAERIAVRPAIPPPEAASACAATSQLG